MDVSGLAANRLANPVARIFKKPANDSPSPWGEGRDEGGREPFEIQILHGQLVAPTRRGEALRRRKSDLSRTPQFEIRNCHGSSGIHFGMDNWDEVALN